MMIRTSLRAGAWPAVLGFSGLAVVVGACGVAFPAVTTAMFTIAFTLLAAAAAFALDEPASQVVDVTPTGPARRTGIRALALLVPVAAGVVLIEAGGQRGLVALILMTPSVLPPVARLLSTFPTSSGNGLSSNTVWWTVLAMCIVTVAVSVRGRLLPRRLSGR
jgi:hypothetical protein